MPQKRWTVGDLLLTSSRFLKEKGITNPRLNSELLLCRALGLDRLRLYLDMERPLTDKELDTFRGLIRRRIAREPLQYILGSCGFYNVDLRVGPGVLIPRQETETLVEIVIGILDAQKIKDPEHYCLDLCTGSGAIAIAVLKERPYVRFLGIDISDRALSYALLNARENNVNDRIEFRRGDLFEPIALGELFHIIVTNPPYVTEEEYEGLQPEITRHEPRDALVAGKDGLSLIRKIVKEAVHFIKAPGALLMEIAPGQAKEVLDLMEKGGYSDLTLHKDLSGRHRAVMGWRL